jgi:hypothetical protein
MVRGICGVVSKSGLERRLSLPMKRLVGFLVSHP